MRGLSRAAASRCGIAAVLELQDMMHQIFIGLIPLSLTLLCYYLLSRKVSINYLIFGVIGLGILISLLGIA